MNNQTAEIHNKQQHILESVNSGEPVYRSHYEAMI